MWVVGALLIALATAQQCGYIPNGSDQQSQVSSVALFGRRLMRTKFFYALYPSANATAPLVLWLQGGPGASGLFGDFLENGPVDVYGKPRATSWTRVATMLYVDNPIGTGFSFTKNNAFPTTDLQIANGLVNFLRGFLAQRPQYVAAPLWVFSESYGGKMAAMFGMQLQKAILAGQIRANFRGVSLGDGWLAPLDCMASYAPFLQAMSLVDAEEAVVIAQYAADAAVALNRDNNGAKATDLWGQQQGYIGNACDGCVSVHR
jgi:serine carboxypeptidase 1